MTLRTLTVTVLVGLLLVLAVPAALAAEVEEVTSTLREQGWYVEPGAEDLDDDALGAQFDPATTPVRPVILAGAPAGGEQAFAEELLPRLDRDATVLVVSPGEIRVVSGAATDDEIDRALVTARSAVDFETADAGAIAVAFAQALDPPVTEAAPAPARRGYGAALLVGAGLATAAVGLVVNRRRRRAYQRARGVMAEAREEAIGQMTILDDRLFHLTDRVELAGDPEAWGLFREATAAYAAARQEVERSTSPQELERVADELDHARWQLEAVAALLEGRATAPRPEREPACFFDPTHGAGVVPAAIDTSAGQGEVRICASCAVTLRTGETPQPRMIVVGGHQVPAPMAPRPYGGGGLEWLSDFAVVLGGQRTPFRWSAYPRPRGAGTPARTAPARSTRRAGAGRSRARH